jgi:hypothetical protein
MLDVLGDDGLGGDDVGCAIGDQDGCQLTAQTFGCREGAEA